MAEQIYCGKYGCDRGIIWMMSEFPVPCEDCKKLRARASKMNDAPQKPKACDEMTDLEPGWYPILYCWDAEEGCFPGGAQWTGSGWAENNVSANITHYWHVKFDEMESAEAYAYENDPNW